ncbi:MAG: Lysophospholipase [Rubritepida sp.]|nr:Lysophospholipase [Rubritepida sp.]
MLNRRSLFLMLGAPLTGCAGARPGAPARQASTLAPDQIFVAEAAPDSGLEAVLPVRAGDDPYAPLAAALRGAQRGSGDARALVMMLGDSHAAGPVMVEHLRELMQARFGAAGIGRLAPGRAQRYFNPSSVEIGQTGEWTARNALRSGTQGPFGLTGYRLTGEREGDSITLRSNEAAGFDRVHLALLAGPDAGSFRLRVDGNWIGPATLRHATPEFRPMHLDVPRGSREIALELIGDGPVELLGWGLDRRGRGVLVEAFGINGATLGSLENRDQTILTRELTAKPPALVILEFGTNEATDPDFDEAVYAAALTRQIQRLRQILPRSGILVMGVPDAGRPVRPTRRQRHPLTGCAAVQPLVSIARVRAVQRSVAQSERTAFFDWSAEVTRSTCRLPEMAAGATPLMRADLVHFTPDGYRLTAERLHAHIMRGTGLGARGTNA